MLFFSALLIFVASVPGPALAQALCGQFGWPARISNPITVDVERAVVRLEIGQASGTGTAFLIDNEKALFLTAKHVVQNVITNPRLVIKGQTWPKRSQTFSMKVVAHHGDLDVAILRAEDASIFSEIRPIEIGVYAASPQSNITGFGYLRGEEQPLSLDGRLGRLGDNVSEYRFRGINFGGDSGAPIFDNSTGLAIGIVTSRQYRGGVGIALGSFAFWKFLMDHADTVDAGRLASSFSGNNARSILSDMLRPGHSSPYISNFDILGLIKILQKISNPSSVNSQLAYCPLFTALVDRKMGLAAAAIAHLQPKYAAADIGRIYLTSASTYFALGEFDESRKNSKLAEASLETAAVVTLLNHPLAARKAACRLAVAIPQNAKSPAAEEFVRAFSAAGITVTEVKFPDVADEASCADANEGEGMSNLVRDLALARYYAAKSQQASELSMAASAAALATELSVDGNLKAANYVLLGQILASHAETAELGARAIATGWQQGYQQTWVLTQYERALLLSSENPNIDLSIDELKTRIIAADTLSDDVLITIRGDF